MTININFADKILCNINETEIPIPDSAYKIEERIRKEKKSLARKEPNSKNSEKTRILIQEKTRALKDNAFTCCGKIANDVIRDIADGESVFIDIKGETKDNDLTGSIFKQTLIRTLKRKCETYEVRLKIQHE